MTRNIYSSRKGRITFPFNIFKFFCLMFSYFLDIIKEQMSIPHFPTLQGPVTSTYDHTCVHAHAYSFLHVITFITIIVRKLEINLIKILKNNKMRYTFAQLNNDIKCWSVRLIHITYTLYMPNL